MSYNKHFSSRRTPQRQAIPGRPEMVKNEAGGYAFPVTDWVRAERFLILGAEGGTYYIKEADLTIGAAQAIVRLLSDNVTGQELVSLIVDISTNNRAARNNPALFALAMAASPDVSPHPLVNNAALLALPKVARIGTHLFQFVEYAESFRGWGRAMKRAVGGWYTNMPTGKLAYQAVKYQQRDGWSHKDVLRLAHPAPQSSAQDAIFKWIVSGDVTDGLLDTDGISILHAHDMAKRTSSETEIISLIIDNRLTREMIPTQFLKSKAVWNALLQNMPMTAMIRNLGKMTSIGLLDRFGGGEALVLSRLRDTVYLKRSRIHPWLILNAMYWYSQGHGMLGSLRWSPNQHIVDALDDAFHNTFGNVEPTGKRIALGIDKSGSMGGRAILSSANPRAQRGMPAVSAVAALAMSIARVEPNHLILEFNTDASPSSISARTRLADAVTNYRAGGGTDYASPITYCAQKKIPIDAFIIAGDEQSWYGRIHPVQALQRYRREMNLPTKMVVMNICSTMTQVDPTDAGMMNITGFDTNAMNLISNFIR